MGENDIGGVVGSNEGTLVQNMGLGSVHGIRKVGGIAGINSNDRSIYQCYYSGSIEGHQMAGGSVGHNLGNIYNTYDFVDFLGGIETAGFVGNNSGNIVKCFSVSDKQRAGQVAFAGVNWGTISSCFFDSETFFKEDAVGSGNSSGVEGWSWKDMRSDNTFHDWDLFSVWHIKNGHSYPYLRWQTGQNGLEITNDDVPIATEDRNYTVQYEAIDPFHMDMRIMWELEANVTWLSINMSTGEVHGVPPTNETEDIHVVVIATDAMGNYLSRSFDIHIAGMNDPPVIIGKIPQYCLEDDHFEFGFNIEDEDHSSNELTVIIEKKPDWMVFNRENLTLSGTPLNGDVGNNTVSIKVTDALGGTDELEFVLVVNNTNDPPSILGSFDETAYEDMSYNDLFLVEDIDPTMDIVLVSMRTSAGWLVFDQVDNEVYGSPGYFDKGIYWVNITADDQKGGISWVNYSIEVVVKYDIVIGPFMYTDGTPFSDHDVMFGRAPDGLNRRTNRTGHFVMAGLYPGEYSGSLYYNYQEYLYNVTVMKDGTVLQVLPDIQKKEEQTSVAEDYWWMIVLVAVFVGLLLMVFIFVFIKTRSPGSERKKEEDISDGDELKSYLDDLTDDMNVEVGRGMEDLYGPTPPEAVTYPAGAQVEEIPLPIPSEEDDDIFGQFDLPEE